VLIYLSRFYVLEPEDNLAHFAADCAQAAEAGAALAVFPEQFITGYYAESDEVQILRQFSTVSGLYPQLLICCGTVTAGGANRQLWFLDGKQVAEYTKVHLFDPGGEREIWHEGTTYAALAHAGLRIGLATCNDLRFPEQMHRVARSGKLHLLVYPALWPWQRDHVWAALLRARAIEHSAFAIGCCVAGVDNGSQRFDGAGNHVFDPLGNEVHPQGRVYGLDLSLFGKPVVDTYVDYRDVCQVSEFSTGV
jgi:predicted amidohydrolase